MSVAAELTPFLPPAPRGIELDDRSLEVQNRIAQARYDVRQQDEYDGRTPAERDLDLGYLSPDSVLRMIQQEPLVSVLGNQWGFVTGMTDEKNATPTIEYMRRGGSITGRDAETAKIFKTVITGSRAEADPEINRVYLMHARVHAEAVAEANGPHPERVVYDPFDAPRQDWTISSLACGYKRVFETIVRPFSDSDAERERLWADYQPFSGVFGSDAPKDPEAYMRQRLDSGELHLTEHAELVVMQVWKKVPVPRILFPFREEASRVVVGLLPEKVREMYGITYDAEQEDKFHKAVTRVARVNRILKLLTSDADTKIFDLAAKQEKRLQARGRAPEIPDPYASAI